MINAEEMAYTEHFGTRGRHWGGSRRAPARTCGTTGLPDLARRLRGIADAHAADFRSDGFARFFAMIVAELDDAYFAEMEAHLSS